MMIFERPILWSSRFVVLSLLWAASAPGQTWQGVRTTPALTEIVAVDSTGELGWLYGFEDLAGDGTQFQRQEQSIDVRTAYATTDPGRFWARIYVSDTQTPGGNVTGYVFIDADRNVTTGGDAIATEIAAQFTTDASPGGYEYVLELPGSGTQVQVWQHQAQTGQYVATAVAAANGVAESGVDDDPIRLFAPRHGYLQASVDLAVVGLTSACTANLYVRSVNTAAALGRSDLEVGQVASCIPADANADGVPDVIVPPAGCVSNAECAGGGICQAGTCVFAAPCVTAADCGANETCTVDGRCVPLPAGNCTTNADCTGGLVCVAPRCEPCTLGGTQCGAGQVCGPDGLCIADQGTVGNCTTSRDCSAGLVCSNGQCGACTPGGTQCASGQLCDGNGRCTSTGTGGNGGLVLEPGEEVEGGACNCSIPARSRPPLPTAVVLALPLIVVIRRRSRHSS